MLAASIMLTLTACSSNDDDDGEWIVPDKRTIEDHSVTAIFESNGLGDRSYNDIIYKGIRQQLQDKDNCSVRNYSPLDWAEAERVIAQWFDNNEPNNIKHRLLILASSNYAEMLQSHPEWIPNDSDKILLLDTKEAMTGQWEHVYTRYISLHKQAFNAGKTVKTELNCDKVAVVEANPEVPAVAEIAQGFIDGFRDAGGTFDEKKDTYYLGKTKTEGFNDESQLYKLSYTLNDSSYNFILPVCGGSCHGLYRYLREQYPSNILTCGVDDDMQDHSINVVFSLVKLSDRLISDYLGQWLDGSEMPTHEIYEEEYSGTIVSEIFQSLIQLLR